MTATPSSRIERVQSPASAHRLRRHRDSWSTFPSRVGYALWEYLMRPVRHLHRRLIARIDERIEVSGMLVIIDGDDPTDRERVRDGLSESLEKVTAWSPRMRRRIDSEVCQILVEPRTTAAWFHPGTLILGLQAFQNTDTDAVASYIVHEAVHARIEARGIRYWPHLRARIERCCLREQLSFLASRGRADLVRHYEEYLRRIMVG